MTLSDLLAYAKREAIIPQSLYFEPGYATHDEIRALRADRSKRDRQRQSALRTFPWRVRNAATEALKPGRYYGGRLIIAEEINYIPGQWAAMEIWPAVLDYLNATSTVEG